MKIIHAALEGIQVSKRVRTSVVNSLYLTRKKQQEKNILVATQAVTCMSYMVQFFTRLGLDLKYHPFPLHS